MALILWIDITDADTYMETKLWSDAWSDALDATKTAALTTAQYQLINDGRWNLSTESPATFARGYAVAEQALFLLSNPGIAKRYALRAQGVIEAGMVEEKYNPSSPVKYPVCTEAQGFLSTDRSSGAVHIIDLFSEEFDPNMDDDTAAELSGSPSNYDETFLRGGGL